MPGQTATLPPRPQCQPAPVRATAAPEPPKQEQKPVASAHRQRHHSGEDDKDGAAFRRFDASDMEMARITEGLINLLIGRNFINFTDFPNMAQATIGEPYRAICPHWPTWSATEKIPSYLLFGGILIGFKLPVAKDLVDTVDRRPVLEACHRIASLLASIRTVPAPNDVIQRMGRQH